MGKDSKIVVPKGMLEESMRASLSAGLPIGPSTEIRIILEAALRWQEEKLSESNVEFHSSILAAERERFPGSDEEGSVVAQRVGFEYGVSFARHYIREMFMGPETPKEVDLSKIEDAFNRALDEIILTHPQIVKVFPMAAEKARKEIREAVEKLRGDGQ